jgi:TrmH family RNA methyltransferase
VPKNKTVLSKNQIKTISSFKEKKFRDRVGVFVAEGEKLIVDLARKFECNTIVATEDFFLSNNIPAKEVIEVKKLEELKQISSLKTPPRALAVFKKSDLEMFNIEKHKEDLVLVLDTIQDTGNFGTILRIADWFGVSSVVCSNTTVDIYNPKVVQATMGALANVSVYYVDLENFMNNMAKMHINIYGTMLDGRNIYTADLTKNGIVVMGNEGNGISPDIQKFITNKLFIPNFSNNTQKSESLNVAAATAITLSEFKRRFS